MRSKLFALWLLAFSFVPELFAQTGISPPDAGLFNKAVACIKEAEGWHGNHLPYVGYGHKILPHEKLTADMTEAQADSLLRADLRKLHKMCSRFGKDALLGYGKIPKSRLIQKLESGNRDIYEEYISFRCYKGKVVPSIERRRKKEFELLYIH